MASILKTNRKRKYNEQDMLDGIAAIRNGMSARKASRTFKIPRTTLEEYDGEKHRGGKMGPPTLFTDEEENILA